MGLEEDDHGKRSQTKGAPCKTLNSSITDLKMELKRPMITGVCKINGQPVEYELDTGATVSVIDENLYHKLYPRPELKESKAKLISATEAPFELLGEIHVPVEFGAHGINTIIYVVKEKLPSL